MTQTPCQFPIYIPSKGRAGCPYTMAWLDRIGQPYYVVVEAQERDEYAEVVDEQRLLILDPEYQRRYETCDPAGDEAGKPPGAGPARNFAWDHAVAGGHNWHWVMDDNIRNFFRANRNRQIRVESPAIFRAMEDFCLRYSTVAMAGPQYFMFFDRHQKFNPISLNTRIYSCNLIRNDVPFRWRGRMNEDTILSLDILKAGWCTIIFNAFLQNKIVTQSVRGGYTDQYISEGTLPKSKILVGVHPDVAKLKWRFGRFHHFVDYRRFATNRLVRADGVKVAEGINEYGMTVGSSTYGKKRSKTEAA